MERQGKKDNQQEDAMPIEALASKQLKEETQLVTGCTESDASTLEQKEENKDGDQSGDKLTANQKKKLKKKAKKDAES